MSAVAKGDGAVLQVQGKIHPAGLFNGSFDIGATGGMKY